MGFLNTRAMRRAGPAALPDHARQVTGKAQDGSIKTVYWLPSVWKLRIVRFGAVASTCALLHLLILTCLVALSVSKAVANATGFSLSAQANFVLSSLITWGDRRPGWAPASRPERHSRVHLWLTRWVQFNTIAVGALFVNELTFMTAIRLGTPILAAWFAGVVTAASVNFTVNHLLTFHDVAATRNEGSGSRLERRPPVGETRMRLRNESVAFFLPAFNEAANLRAIVPRIVEYFDDLGRPFTVIIVDDGSTRDDTYGTGEQLARSYPAHVQVVHHVHNHGYGGALKTGIRASLETGHSLIGFCDADQQFEIESFGTLLAALKEKEPADLAAGYRLARADSLKRRLMGRGWKWLSTLVLGFSGVRDVDCGFKLFTRPMLTDIAPRLHEDYAAVSPELLARAAAAGYGITQAGVTHKPRRQGRQTGADLKVVLMSLIQLFQLRLMLRREMGHQRHDDAPDSPRTPTRVAR